MKKSLCLALAGALVLAAAGSAHAEPGFVYAPPKAFTSVLRDRAGHPVHSTDGNCVHTKWAAKCDECAPLPPPPPPPPAIISQKERSVFFSFGSSKLTHEAKKQLETLAGELKGRPGVVGVRITGFADRIGKAEANEKLSKKRADAVREFLVSKGVVLASVTETRWFGAGMPSTQCGKELAKAELVKCLQNDRRVDVVVDTMPVPAMFPPGVLPPFMMPPHGQPGVPPAHKAHHKHHHKAAPSMEKPADK